MKMKKVVLCLCVLVLAFLAGCSVTTVEEMYALPKRTDAYQNLQAVIDKAMSGLSYSAPLSGEYQQTVQMVDLDGDTVQEYLLFAKGGSDAPLQILVFQQQEDDFVHVDTMTHTGSDFVQVEYAQMDDKPGVEVVVGCQLSDQLLRTMAVYSFSNGQMEQRMTATYTRFMTSDLDLDGFSELFVLHPGEQAADFGVAEIYKIENGNMQRSNEVAMSQPVDKLKRIIVGKLHDVEAGVYVASAVDENSLVTDVFIYEQGKLTNAVLSNESGTNVRTLRNYYVYAYDIDNDGVVELPDLTPMLPLKEVQDRHDLVRWYAMTSGGAEILKSYTYHNFAGGWYMTLDASYAKDISVYSEGSTHEFYIWGKDQQESKKLMTVHTLTGLSREEQARTEGYFVLLKTDTVIYAAVLEPEAEKYGITQDSLVQSFHLIQRAWKTGEI